jgi:hypothetical protein
VFLDVIVDDVCDDVTCQSLKQIHFEEFLVRIVEDGNDGVALTMLVFLRKLHLFKNCSTKIASKYRQPINYDKVLGNRIL